MNKFLNLCIAISLFLSIGCSPKYYVPNTQNVPMVSAQGQTNLSVAGNGNQVEFQGAYGINDALALQINGGLVIPQEEDNGNGGSGKLIEGGLGYYSNINAGLLFDVYALIGFGSMKNDFPTTVPTYPNTTGKISAKMVRLGLQPSISYHQKYFSISGSARISSLSYNNVEGSLIFEDVDQVRYLEDNKSNFMIEPALTLRGGLEKLKVQIQLAKSFNLSNSSFKQDDTLLSVGLNFNFQ
ncbi:MAG: hypothetical protein H7246_20940 [Phycisphaerae bacterium]|nr:hypothetical protein [Saprospiraceae bacterium]